MTKGCEIDTAAVEEGAELTDPCIQVGKGMEERTVEDLGRADRLTGGGGSETLAVASE